MSADEFFAQPEPAGTASSRLEPDVVVVGAGPAGLAAAAAAAETGAHVAVIDRDDRLGGILNQCVHDGFGLELYEESLTGPEYAARQAAEVAAAGIDTYLDSTVLAVQPVTPARLVCEVLTPQGHRTLAPGAVVLAMGCRERSFGSLAIPGGRPAGIYSAGTAQRLVNIDGLMVGRRAVVLGSGDVGLIMARRMTLEGAEVACVVEKMPFAGGLARNVSQCLNDFDIPLLLSHTIVEVLGAERVTGVVVAEVDGDGRTQAGTERTIECDTILASVGLIPENELTRDAGAQMDPRSGGAAVDQDLMTSIPGVFACGNVLRVHDIADWASLEGVQAGLRAADWAGSPWLSEQPCAIESGPGVRYVVPQRIAPGVLAAASLRVREPCAPATIAIIADGETLIEHRYPYVAPSELVRFDLPPLPEGTRNVEVRRV